MEILDKIKNRLLTAKKKAEAGLTMPEMVMVVVIIGILVTIGYPSWTAVQNQIHENNVKTAVARAALLIEQETIDNNGLVPKYVPNEIRDDELLSTFSYSHKDRLKWCITAKVDKNSLIPWGPNYTSIWYASSEDKEASRNGCGVGYTLLEGSSLPWKLPTVTTPAIRTAQTRWDIKDANATALATASESRCILSAEDQDAWGGSVEMSYALRVTNQTTARAATYTSEWATDPATLTIPQLEGSWPDDSIKFEVRSRCTLTAGTPYQYYSSWSSPFTSNVVRYAVPTLGYEANSPSIDIKRGGPTVKSAITANLTGVTACPAPATRKLTLKTIANGKSSSIESNNTPLAGDLQATLIPGYAHTNEVQASCVYQGGPVLSSAKNSKDVPTALRPPITNTVITPSTDQSPGNTNYYSPNLLSWDNSNEQCTYGTMMHDINFTRFVGNGTIQSKVTNYTSLMYELTNGSVGTRYQVKVTTFCSGIIDSALKRSADALEVKSLDFTFEALTPEDPIGGTITVSNTGTSAFTKDTINLNNIYCTNDATLRTELNRKKNSNSVPGGNLNLGSMTYNGTTKNAIKLIPTANLNWLANQQYVATAWCDNGHSISGKRTFTTKVYNALAPEPATNQTWNNTLEADNDQALRWGNTSICPATTEPWVRVEMTKINGTATVVPPYIEVPLAQGAAAVKSARPAPGGAQTIKGILVCRGLDAEVHQSWKSLSYTKTDQRLYPGTVVATWTGSLVYYSPLGNGISTNAFSYKTPITSSSWDVMNDWIVTDYNGDGVLDIVVTWGAGKSTYTGGLYYYPGNKNGGLGSPIKLGGTGWDKFRITMATNWGKDTASGNADVSKPTTISKAPDGSIRTYTYNTSAAARIYPMPAGTPSLTAMTVQLMAADVNNDGVPDLITQNSSALNTYVHAYSGLNHSFTTRSAQTLSGLARANVNAVSAADGFSWVDRNDTNFSGIIAAQKDGILTYYPSNSGTGKYSTGELRVGSGWSQPKITSTGWGWEPFPGHNI